MTDSKTFIKITNRDIYRKLCGIELRMTNINVVIGWHSKAIAAIIIILTVLIGCIV